jgi:regulatory protein|tara:strand:+ start:203 stop:601 length:399 start_codon:yes stop_codon:yes gene_type:complete
MELNKKINPYAASLKIPNQDIKNLLDELVEKSWQSDIRFTEQFIFSKKNKYGLRKVAHELKLRGVDSRLISEGLSSVKSEEFLLAKKIWSKKYNHLPESIEEKTKQIRFLQSRGIELDLILKILTGKSPETT